MKPTKSKFIVLKQICEYIPRNLVAKLANEHKVTQKCRTFSAWSHVTSLIFAQLSHSLSLNDVCDTQHHPAATDYLMRILYGQRIWPKHYFGRF